MKPKIEYERGVTNWELGSFVCVLQKDVSSKLIDERMRSCHIQKKYKKKKVVKPAPGVINM